MKYIVSILLVFITCAVQAQFGPAPIAKDTSVISNTNKKTKQKPIRDFKPSAVKIGIDAFGLGRTAFTSDFSHFEAQVDIDFHRYFLVVDFGNERNTISSNDFTYNNEGSYFRLGLQANMTQFNKNGNIIFFGLRYARSSFKDDLTFTESTDHFGTATSSVSNANLSSRWFEINTGMKVHVLKNFFLGYTLRVKLIKSNSASDELSPYIIPGFGLARKGGNIGFNYYVLYRIPFRKKAIPQKILKSRGNGADR